MKKKEKVYEFLVCCGFFFMVRECKFDKILVLEFILYEIKLVQF